MSCKILTLTHAALCTLTPPAQPYYIGDDWSVKLQFNDASGNPLDLAGKSFRAAIKNQQGTVLMNRDSADSAQIEIIAPTTLGQIRLKIARTESVIAGIHNIDVVQVAADSSEQTWARGSFESAKRHTPTPLP